MIQFDVRIVFKWVETQPLPSNWRVVIVSEMWPILGLVFLLVALTRMPIGEATALPLWGRASCRTFLV